MIPRIIHQVWVGGPVPDQIADWMDTWKAQHPGWEYRLWGDGDFGWLRHRDLFDRAEEIASGSEGQFRSDLARYEILHEHGGVYVDADFECLRPIDDLLDAEFFTAWERDKWWANMAIAGAIPGHPFLDKLIDGIPANVARRAGRRPNWLTGPRYITPILLRRSDVTVHPAEMFFPYAWNELDRASEEFPGARAVHHWWNQRTNPTLRKNA